MNKFLMTTALTASFFVLGTANLHAQVNRNLYRQNLVRPVRQPLPVVRPNINYNYYAPNNYYSPWSVQPYASNYYGYNPVTPYTNWNTGYTPYGYNSYVNPAAYNPFAYNPYFNPYAYGNNFYGGWGY